MAKNTKGLLCLLAAVICAFTFAWLIPYAIVHHDRLFAWLIIGKPAIVSAGFCIYAWAFFRSTEKARPASGAATMS